MKGRRSLLWIGLCALGLSLSTAAIGCGDDDSGDTGGSGGAGSGAGGKVSTAGKSGSSAGMAGKGGSGAGGSSAVTVDKCAPGTTDLMKSAAHPLPAACITCLCTENAMATVACDNNAQCWPLLECVNTKCAGQDPTACAPTMCTSSLGGATQAMGIGSVLQGACASKCGVSGEDAGVDAGF